MLADGGRCFLALGYPVVRYAGTGRNSSFTHAFLDVFATPDKDIELVLRDMAARVSDLTNGAQAPQRLSELRRALVLAPTK